MPSSPPGTYSPTETLVYEEEDTDCTALIRGELGTNLVSENLTYTSLAGVVEKFSPKDFNRIANGHRHGVYPMVQRPLHLYCAARLWAASGLFQASEEAMAGWLLTLSSSKFQEYAEYFEALRKPWIAAHGWNHGKWDEIALKIMQNKTRCLGVFFFTSFLEYVRERQSSMKDISGLEAQVDQWRPFDASARLEQQLLLKEMRIGQRTRELPSWTGVVSKRGKEDTASKRGLCCLETNAAYTSSLRPHTLVA